jgi:hypothetical protein
MMQRLVRDSGSQSLPSLAQLELKALAEKAQEAKNLKD